MTSETREPIFCPICGAENPKISQCVRCGDKLPILNHVVTLNPKDFVQKPRGIWLVMFLLFAGFLRSCMALTVAQNSVMFAIYSFAMVLSAVLLYGLWKLMTWARYGILIIGYVGLARAIWNYIYYCHVFS